MIPMAVRYAKARATVSAQRRQLLRLHRENTALSRENRRLRAAVGADAAELRAMLTASTDESKQLAVKFHDRCLDLTRANATQKCPSCRSRTTSGQEVAAV